MYITEDIPEIVARHQKARIGTPQTKGFRHISEIKYDDLTYRSKKHLEACGNSEIFENEIGVLGDNILQSPLERALLCFLRTEKYND